MENIVVLALLLNTLSLCAAIYIELTPHLCTEPTLLSYSSSSFMFVTYSINSFTLSMAPPNHLLVESQWRNVVNRCETLYL